MKKLSAVFLCFLLLVSGCNTPKSTPAEAEPLPAVKTSPNCDTYFIDAKLENNILTATQRVNYVNKEEAPLNEIYFHLYPLCYNDTSLMDKDFLPSLYPGGFNPGGIEISEVSVLGVPLDVEQNKLNLKVKLGTPLTPMRSIIITFKYKVTLPKNLDRFGYTNTCYKLTNFYPVAAVYDNGWKIDDYNLLGDPFFSDSSDFFLTLRVQKELVIASSGKQQRQNDEDGKAVYKISAKNVRDIAVVADSGFKTLSDTVGDTTLNVYAYDEKDCKIIRDYAAAALDFFNQTFGKYPYDTYSVCACDFFENGMEYSNLSLISRSLFEEENSRFFEWVVAHETAHQWWFCLVGSDSVKEPFLDEGLAEYSALQYMRYKYDDEIFDDIKNTFILKPYSQLSKSYDGKAVARPLSEYKSMEEMSALIYAKSCMMYMDMENVMGKEKLLGILKDYYEENAYGIASFESLKSRVKTAHTHDWDGFFKKWLF